MKKVFNFSDFSALYESADVYDQNLKIIVSELLDLYCEMADYGEYPDSKIYSDFDSILAGNSIKNKIEAFKKIMGEAKTKSLTGNKIAGAKELFDMMDLSYSEFLKALNYIADKYEVAAGDTDVVKKEKAEDSKLLAEVINKVVSDLDAYLKENEPKVSESDFNFSGDPQIFEGKKSRLSDAEDGINLLRGKIDSYKMDEDPRKQKFAIDADLKIVSIANSIKALKAKKNRDIEKSEIEKVITDLSDLETNFETGINKIIDENTTDQELEKLRNKARDVNYKIKPLRKAYLDNKSDADSKTKAEGEKSEKIKVKLGTDYIDYTPEENNTPNPEVKKFQELVVDAFKNIKAVTDLPFYQKMGTTGRFGPNTRDMIKFLKAAFGLSDKSGDITKELMDEIQIQRDTIKESIFPRVYRFSSFVNISEAAFNLAAGLEVAKTLPTYKSYKAKSSGSGSKSSEDKSQKGGSKEAVEEAKGTEFNLDKTSEEKWKWLTNTYVVGYDAKGKADPVEKVELSSDGKTFTIWWDKTDPGSGKDTSRRICYYPTAEKQLGKYKDINHYYRFPLDPSERGVWGNKIDIAGTSKSGNFAADGGYPTEADKTKFRNQAKNVRWLADNFEKYFKKIGTVNVYTYDLTATKKYRMPGLQFIVTKSISGYGSRFLKGTTFKFFGDGTWESKDDKKYETAGTWRYDPELKDIFVMKENGSSYDQKIEKSSFPI